MENLIFIKLIKSKLKLFEIDVYKNNGAMNFQLYTT